MNALLALWLPILLSAVVVFVISSILHMVIKHHASDCQALPNEDAVRDAVRAGNLAPGGYVMPHCKDMKDMRGEAMQKKYRDGPVAHLTVLPNGMPNMGKYLGLWFVWIFVISVVAAFLASQIYGLTHSRALGAAKLIGAVTFVAYGFGTVTESIWMGRPWSVTAKNLFDSALYGIGSALVFYWLWP